MDGKWPVTAYGVGMTQRRGLLLNATFSISRHFVDETVVAF